MSLKVQNIVKKYGDFLAVNNLSFEVKDPGVFALLGTNGAGKTTAIRVILGMLARESGNVSWKGKDLQVVNERVGYLAEERGLYPKYNIIEQMMYFGELKGMKRTDTNKAINYWFDRLNVNEYRSKKAEQLSKGNQQKIQLAIALLSDPELLILDEPLSGLDPVNTDLFKSIINEQISKKKYIIMSSHQMPTVEEFCENITIMHRGNAVLQGNLAEIKKSYGRVNLSVKAECDVKLITDTAESCGLKAVKTTPNGLDFYSEREEYAQNMLKKLIENNVNIVKFELREKSLHEIFVEKVGGDANEG